MNRQVFFASLRRRNSGVFGTSLSSGQVQGVEAILDECKRQGADLGQAAYILATAYGETGGKMQPVRENMNYSARRIPQVFSASRRQGISPQRLAGNPKLLANTVYGGAWGKKNLGNIHPNDGWDFRGGMIGQITGRYNFKKWSAGLGVDLIGNPSLIDRLDISVKALVCPMLEGWATGLSLPQFVRGEKRDYEGARRVWNGTFEAAKYAGYAKAFEAALISGGWKDGEKPKAPTPEPPRKAKPASYGGFLQWLLKFMAGRNKK